MERFNWLKRLNRFIPYRVRGGIAMKDGYQGFLPLEDPGRGRDIYMHVNSGQFQLVQGTQCIRLRCKDVLQLADRLYLLATGVDNEVRTD